MVKHPLYEYLPRFYETGKKPVHVIQMAISVHDELTRRHFRVAIFGSARIQPDDRLYRQVFNLSKALSEEGADVVTGGGPGLMAAAVAGHKAAKGGHKSQAIGLTIKLPFEEKTSQHLDVKEEFDRFSDRLDHFMALSNAVVIAPGGVGTLLEFMYTWQLVQVKHVCHIPIILLGDMWPELVRWIRRRPLAKNYLNPEDLKLLYAAKDNHCALKIIREAHAAFKKGGKNFCLNYEKYRVA